MRKINRKRSSCFFAIHTCTPSKTSTPNAFLALKQMWMTAPLSKLCLHHLLPHPKAWCYHSNPLTTGNCLRQKGRKCKRGWGAVEKESWLFNTKKTGMQGVNPFEGSSANKRTGLQTKVGGGTHGGRGWLSLTIWPFCLGEGGWWRGRYSVAPLSP